MNLMEQLSREEICWFLFISILQLLPYEFSPLASWGTISPLCLIIFVSMAKDWYNTRKILKSDDFINKQRAVIIEDFDGEPKTVLWEDIKVGSLVIVDQNEPCPADAILLCSSSDDGMAFVETSNMDGEIRFQQKESVNFTKELFELDLRKIKESIEKLKDSELKVEQPNNALHEFKGSLKLKDFNEEFLISIKNLLLRGSKIKNVRQVLGLVVFTGPDTKLMQNSTIYRRKKYSKVQKKLTNFFWFISIEIIIFASISTIMSIVNFYKNGQVSIYDEDFEKVLENIFTFLILYNNLIPISLYVTLDFAKLFQAWFIDKDRELVCKTDEKKSVSVKNSDLNEELGQVEYIFTDKTGTLTGNQMEFKKCWINGEYFDDFHRNELIENSIEEPNIEFNKIDIFWICVGLCHTTKCDTNNSYKSVSPDEIALVSAAAKVGYKYKSNQYGIYRLETPEGPLQYSIVATNEYSSERKRMSIVVKFYESHHRPPMLICKGADSVMIPLLDSLSNSESVNEAVTQMAKEGLRTLVYGCKYLTVDELKEFNHRHQDAMHSMADNKTSLEKLAEDFEKDLTLVGVSGVEDKVIEGVPETVDMLKEAGIKFWLMTGDKKETVENVAYASNIIEQDTEMVYLEDSDTEEIIKKLLIHLIYFLYPQSAAYEGSENPPSILKLENSLEKLQNTEEIAGFIKKFSIVTCGVSISKVFENQSALKYFTLLSTFAYSVICCRIVPYQKAQIVKLIKDHFKFRPITLAVGDGSNDVCMIQEANIGIGIMGREGMQAANSADYAICDFTQLSRLLLVHGRNNYSRTCKLIFLSFFKNFLAILPLHYYSYISYYSGTCLYDAWLIMTYNIFMTSLPVLVIAVMEKERKLESNSKAHKNGIKCRLLNWKKFFYWKFSAICASIFLFLLIIVDSNHTVNSESFSLSGTLLFIVAVITSLGVFMVEMNEWNFYFLGSILISLIALTTITIGFDYSGFPTTEIKNVINQILVWPKNLILLTTGYFPILILFLLFMFLSVRKIQSGFSSMHPESVSLRSRSIYLYLSNTKKLRKYSRNISRLFRTQNIKSLIKKILDQQPNDFKRSSLTQVFVNSHIEETFLKFRAERSIKYVRYMLCLIFLGNILWSIYGIYTYIARNVFDMLITRISLLLLTFFSVFFSTRAFFLDKFELCLTVLIVGGLIAKTTVEFIYDLDGSMSTATGAIITFIILRIYTYKAIFIWSIFLIIYLIRISILYKNFGPGSYEILVVYYCVTLIGITLISSYIGLTIENSNRDAYVTAKDCDEKYRVGKRIISRLLPTDIIDDIEKKRSIIQESYVTIMFCEILNFDKIVTDLQREDLMEMLNKYTLMMDNLCEKKKITKIETVNKTYVACCGLKGQVDHGLLMIELAVEIINKFRPYKVPKTGDDFQLRIGINTGPVTSGVIGDHKPQFCLVGDTMNIASRMCSTIKEPNKIRISDSTYKYLRNRDSWNFKEDNIHFKGRRGPVKTYFVQTYSNHISRVSSEFSDIPVNNLLRESGRKIKEVVNKRAPKRTLSIFEIEFIRTDDFKRSETSFFLSENNNEECLFSEEIQWNVLVYYENIVQEKYRLDFIERNEGNIKKGLLLNLFFNIFVEFAYVCHYSIISNEKQVAEFICIIIRAGIILALFLIYLNYQKIVHKRSYQWLIVILYSIKALVEALSSLINFGITYILILESMYTSVSLNHSSGLLFGYILAFSSIQSVLWIIAAKKGLITFFDELFFILFFILINLVASSAREYFDRESYNLKIKAKAAIKRTQKLLKQMIPERVYSNLTEGKPVLDYFKDIPILFADICGFTAFSTNRLPQDIIKMLSKLFSSFEKYTIECNCYKVHTIGDCYVALGVNYDELGVQNFSALKNETGIQNILKLAQRMIEKLKRSKNLNMLSMRIGIHTGNVIAGIVGTKIVRYDIYGKDVDIANLVESAGEPGKVNVSETTKAFLDRYGNNKYRFVTNKPVNHKPSQTELMTYLLDSIEKESRSLSNV